MKRLAIVLPGIVSCLLTFALVKGTISVAKRKTEPAPSPAASPSLMKQPRNQSRKGPSDSFVEQIRIAEQGLREKLSFAKSLSSDSTADLREFVEQNFHDYANHHTETLLLILLEWANREPSVVVDYLTKQNSPLVAEVVVAWGSHDPDGLGKKLYENVLHTEGTALDMDRHMEEGLTTIAKQDPLALAQIATYIEKAIEEKYAGTNRAYGTPIIGEEEIAIALKDPDSVKRIASILPRQAPDLANSFNASSLFEEVAKRYHQQDRNGYEKWLNSLSPSNQQKAKEAVHTSQGP